MEIKLNIVNISFFPNLVCRCNVVLIKDFRTHNSIAQERQQAVSTRPTGNSRDSPVRLESILFFCLKHTLLLLLMLMGTARGCPPGAPRAGLGWRRKDRPPSLSAHLELLPEAQFLTGHPRDWGDRRHLTHLLPGPCASHQNPPGRNITCVCAPGVA